MRQCRAALACLLLGVALLAGSAHAQATRTWVSGVGDDANPCSRTAPCKTFAGAISKTATGGEIDVLDPGGFGALTITKALTIDGGGFVASVLVAGTNGIIVNITSGLATDVVQLRNIQLEGLGSGLDGIRFLSGAALHVQNVLVKGFTGAGIDFTPSSGSPKLFVTGSSVQKCAGGVKVAPTGSAAVVATIQDTTLNGNTTYGMRVEGNSSAMARNVVADGNLNGFYVTDTTGADPVLSLDHCTAAHNSGAGIRSGFGGLGLAKAFLSDTSVFENGTGLQLDGNGQIFTFGNNRVFGNSTAGAFSGPVPQS